MRKCAFDVWYPNVESIYEEWNDEIDERGWIDIKKSAEIWWDKHHKSSVMDVFLKKRAKNKYAGDKCFNFIELYIRLYVGEDEIVFKKKFPDEVDTSDACEFRMWWDDINAKINQWGYWLFGEEKKWSSRQMDLRKQIS